LWPGDFKIEAGGLNRRQPDFVEVSGRLFKVSQGGLSGTVIDIQLILKTALESLSHSIIICHNHPYGNTQPSEADKQIT